jgi:hypothetical protein
MVYSSFCNPFGPSSHPPPNPIHLHATADHALSHFFLFNLELRMHCVRRMINQSQRKSKSSECCLVICRKVYRDKSDKLELNKETINAEDVIEICSLMCGDLNFLMLSFPHRKYRNRKSVLHVTLSCTLPNMVDHYGGQGRPTLR